MKVECKSTPRIVKVRGVPCRVWEGTTPEGVRLLLLVRAVVVDELATIDQLERELCEINPLEVQGELEDPNDRWTIRE